jgi:uncharacterized protein with NRDE domain
VSAPFIVDPVYGTRASTIVTVSRDGVVTFAERRFDTRAVAIGEVSERFAAGTAR